MKPSQLSRLKDDELLERLRKLVREANRNLAALLRHLAEFDSRRLYLEQACSSLFSYCVRRLGFSEAATYHRITAARLGRRYPAVFEHVEAGRLHLTAVRLLAPHLTDANHAELLELAGGQSKRELERLLAARFPRPDALTLVRKLPAANCPRAESEPASGAPSPAASSLRAELGLASGATSAAANPSALAAQAAEPPASSAGVASQVTPEPLRPALPAPRRAPLRERLEPLSSSRYKVQFTASAELAEKIAQARELSSHHLEGDLASLFEKALDLFIAHEKKRRFAKTSTPRPKAPAGQPESRHVPAEVRRRVWERDQGRCSYVNTEGRRCEERRYLEFDHALPRARGGRATVDNIRLLCRAHNQQRARDSYGAEYVEEQIRRACSGRRPPVKKLREPRAIAWRRSSAGSARDQNPSYCLVQSQPKYFDRPRQGSEVLLKLRAVSLQVNSYSPR